MPSQPITKLASALILTLIAYLGETSLAAQAVQTNIFLNINTPVPDGNVAGLSDVQMVSSSISQLSSVRVKLHLQGEFNGDLYGYLRHVTPNTTNFCVLLNRPGRRTDDPFGHDDSGFDITFEDSAENGDVHNYRTVLTLAPGAPLTGSWQSDGRRVSPMAVSATTPRTATLSSFVGGPAGGEWTLFLADVESGGTNFLVSWGLEFFGRSEPVITWATPADIVYGTPLGPAQLNAFISIPGTFVYSPPAGHVLNAGPAQTLTVVFTPQTSQDSVTTNVTINVRKGALTISAENATKVYGAPLPPLSASYSGFVNGDTLANLDAAALIATSAVADSPVGDYPIIVSDASDSDYEIAFTRGYLSVTPAHTIAILTISTNPPLPSQSVTFTFAARAVAPSIAVPSGEVLFKVNGRTQPVPLAAGTATFTLSTVILGNNAVTAEYAGDLNFIGVTNRFDQHVNTPPVAVDDQLQRNLTGGAQVLIATLLANDSDPDGDAITLLSVSPVSYNRGSVTQDGNWVYYTAPAGSAGDDIFTYTISDGRGPPVTGIVRVKVADSSSPNLAIAYLGNNALRVRLRGTPNLVYRIEYADQLSPANWQILTSRAADDLGAIELIDTPPAGSTGRFYRAVAPADGQ